MKIKNIYHFLVVLIVCACTGLNGWFFGQAGGDAGAITGIVTGIISGFLFLKGYYHKKKINDMRLSTAVRLGAIYGAISGFLVHVPKLVMYYMLGRSEVYRELFSAQATWIGPIVGLISGAILGFFLGILLSCFRMELVDDLEPVDFEEKPKDNA